MTTATSEIAKLANREYKYGFVTEIEADQVPPGLNEDIIRLISAKKQEPKFLLEWRLKAYRHWLTMEEPRWWPNLRIGPIDYQKIVYYSAPKPKKQLRSLDEVDPELRRTFERLGISLEEQKRLAGVAVDAVFDSVSVATTFKKKLAELGIIFCSFSEAVREHPDLVQKYLGSVVPYTDNFFAALNSAVFSDGSFCYIPKGVRCPMELSTYFRINAAGTGQFERTLIIAEEGAYVSYLEGCHPAGERVVTPKGWVNIESLQPGDVVYDHQGQPRKVRAVMVRRHQGEMITIRPASPYHAFRLTPEHPVLAIQRTRVSVKRSADGDKGLPEVDPRKLLQTQPEWIKAGELKKGDFILVPKLQAWQHSKSLSDGAVESLDGYAAEGSTYYNWTIHQRANQPSFAKKERTLPERVAPLLACAGGQKVYLTEIPDRRALSAACYARPLSDRGGVLFARLSEHAVHRPLLYHASHTAAKKWDLVCQTPTHFLIPIQEISREPWDDLVFNLDVEESHSYLVRGFAVHNCTAPMRDENQLHAAVVELIAAGDNAEIKYSTVQNWYPGDEQGRGGIYNFVTKRGACRGRNSKISWTQVETGSAITWKYPSVILQGEGSVGEFYSVALTNHYQQADTGTKMIHIGKNTRSTIVSKGISAGHGQNTYRGLVKILQGATNSRNYSQCDSLLLGDQCGAHTFPYIEVRNRSSTVEHEATTSKISEDQIFYCKQRGLSTEDAVNLIVNGFCKEVFRELPMEFAVEAQKLLSISLEGSVG